MEVEAFIEAIQPLGPQQRANACALVLRDVQAPIDAFLIEPQDTRNPLHIDIHLDILHELTHLYRTSLFPLLHHTIYSSHIHDITRLEDQLRALRANVFDPVAPHPIPAQRPSLVLRDGRFTVDIDEAALTLLFHIGLTDIAIATVFRCSRHTILRHRRQLGLSRREMKHRYSDQFIEAVCTKISPIRPKSYSKGPVLAIAHYLSNANSDKVGYRSVAGYLLSVGIQTPRVNMRRLLNILDDRTGQLREPHPVERRVYYVPFVNSVWHIDGQHKLIRWKFVIHAAIDGKSHLIPYMSVASNNWPETVCDLFKGGIDRWGWPSRVRADHGGENVGVRALMEEVRGPFRGSFMQGRSVHNVRIERLWRDVGARVTKAYSAAFSHLEREWQLKHDNPIDLYALHIVFTSQIQHSLNLFMAMWNNHSMSTRGLANLTPLQQWWLGYFHAKNLGYDLRLSPRLPPGEEEDYDNYEEGMEEEGGVDATMATYPAPAHEGERERLEQDPHVEVPRFLHLVPAALKTPTVMTYIHDHYGPDPHHGIGYALIKYKALPLPAQIPGAGKHKGKSNPGTVKKIEGRASTNKLNPNEVELIRLIRPLLNTQVALISANQLQERIGEEEGELDTLGQQNLISPQDITTLEVIRAYPRHALDRFEAPIDDRLAATEAPKRDRNLPQFEIINERDHLMKQLDEENWPAYTGTSLDIAQSDGHPSGKRVIGPRALLAWFLSQPYGPKGDMGMVELLRRHQISVAQLKAYKAIAESDIELPVPESHEDSAEEDEEDLANKGSNSAQSGQNSPTQPEAGPSGVKSDAAEQRSADGEEQAAVAASLIPSEQELVDTIQEALADVQQVVQPQQPVDQPQPIMIMESVEIPVGLRTASVATPSSLEPTPTSTSSTSTTATPDDSSAASKANALLAKGLPLPTSLARQLSGPNSAGSVQTGPTHHSTVPSGSNATPTASPEPKQDKGKGKVAVGADGPRVARSLAGGSTLSSRTVHPPAVKSPLRKEMDSDYVPDNAQQDKAGSSSTKAASSSTAANTRRSRTPAGAGRTVPATSQPAKPESVTPPRRAATRNSLAARAATETSKSTASAGETPNVQDNSDEEVGENYELIVFGDGPDGDDNEPDSMDVDQPEDKQAVVPKEEKDGGGGESIPVKQATLDNRAKAEGVVAHRHSHRFTGKERCKNCQTIKPRDNNNPISDCYGIKGTSHPCSCCVAVGQKHCSFREDGVPDPKKHHRRDKKKRQKDKGKGKGKGRKRGRSSSDSDSSSDSEGSSSSSSDSGQETKKASRKRRKVEPQASSSGGLTLKQMMTLASVSGTLQANLSNLKVDKGSTELLKKCQHSAKVISDIVSGED